MTARQRLDVLDRLRLIHWPTKGSMPRFKRYLTPSSGAPLTDIVTDIPPLSASAKEKTGYPTQKPLALLDRIIRASSNERDMVFDPFGGRATALVATDRLQRQWAGIDLSPLAVRLVDERIAGDRGLWGGATALDTLPKRSDLGDLPNYRTHRHRLYGEQEGVCKGCDTHFPFRVMEVDHALPKSRGGSDHPDNLQLLCSGCNRSKGGRTMAEWKAALQRLPTSRKEHDSTGANDKAIERDKVRVKPLSPAEPFCEAQSAGARSPSVPGPRSRGTDGMCQECRSDALDAEQSANFVASAGSVLP